MVRETTRLPRQPDLPAVRGARRGPPRARSPPCPAASTSRSTRSAREAEEVERLGIGGVILFGLPSAKDAVGSEGYADDGVVQQAVRAIRAACRELLVVTDVCLCEYTSHGHCGVVEDGEVQNDPTLDAPRPDGRLAREGGRGHRRPLGHDGRARGRDPRGARRRRASPTLPILSYAAKYASAFYGPFREAADSAPQFGDRRGYQMDPANVREALREVRARRRGGRRHRDGQARAALPRRHPRGGRDAPTAPSPPTTSPASTRW